MSKTIFTLFCIKSLIIGIFIPHLYQENSFYKIFKFNSEILFYFFTLTLMNLNFLCSYCFNKYPSVKSFLFQSVSLLLVITTIPLFPNSILSLYLIFYFVIGVTASMQIGSWKNPNFSK